MQSETTSRANWYRGRAADCLAINEHAPTDPVKAMLADMAARWVRLAEIVHRWEGGDGRDPPEGAAGETKRTQRAYAVFPAAGDFSAVDLPSQR